METAALTRGSIPPQLVSLALPLIFGNILQQLYNTIDAMVIGRFAGGDRLFRHRGGGDGDEPVPFFSSAAAAQASPSSLPSSMAAGIWPASGRRGFWPLSSAACSPWC